MDHETLQVLWFFLIAALWIGFFFLEGFDFGVGMLLPFLGRNDVERRAIINTIGPVWDANEMWLIVAITAMFGVFPAWYGTMFSGFYLAMLAIGSFLSSFLFGLVFTNLLGGVPIDQNLNYAGAPFGWITPYGLIGGLT